MPPPTYLTVDEFADALRISRSSVYELIREGRIRAVQIGRIYRIPLDELGRFHDRDREVQQ